MIKLSPSKLSTYKDCPRCFWLEQVQKVARPRGIFPSLPGGMDLLIKKSFDKFRSAGTLPEELKKVLPGKLIQDLKLLEMWRSWRTTNLKYDCKETGAILSGALDECLIDGDVYIPVDYKTRGCATKEDIVVYAQKYYQTQLDCYTLMLESSGYKTRDESYLLFFWPEEFQDNNVVKLHCEPAKLKTSKQAAMDIVRSAAKCLQGEMPAPNSKCEHCGYIAARETICNGLKEKKA